MKKMYEALPVVKKLPALLKGNSSPKNKNIKGIAVILLFNADFKKYFFTTVR